MPKLEFFTKDESAVSELAELTRYLSSRLKALDIEDDKASDHIQQANLDLIKVHSSLTNAWGWICCRPVK